MVQLKTHNSQLKNLNNGKSKRYKIPYFDPSREAPKEILPLQKNGKMLPRRISGNSLKFQRKVAQAIKKARQMSLLPYVTDLLK